MEGTLRAVGEGVTAQKGNSRIVSARQRADSRRTGLPASQPSSISLFTELTVVKTANDPLAPARMVARISRLLPRHSPSLRLSALLSVVGLYLPERGILRVLKDRR